MTKPWDCSLFYIQEACHWWNACIAYPPVKVFPKSRIAIAWATLFHCPSWLFKYGVYGTTEWIIGNKLNALLGKWSFE